MTRITAAKRLLAVVGAVGLLAAAGAAQADDEGYLGVVLQDINPSMAKALQLGDEGGALVNRVVDESPAAAAGLQDGDVILSFDGKKLEDHGDLTRAVRDAKPGDEVEIVVLREGKKRTLTAKLGEREDDVAWFGDDDEDFDFPFEGDDSHVFVLPKGKGDVWVQRFGDDDDVHAHLKSLYGDRGYLGVRMDDMSGQMQEYFGVDGGALVTEVIEDSPAAAAGLKAGDVIVKVGDQDVDSADALHEALAGTEADQKVTVEVVRKGDRKSLDVTLGELPEGTMGQAWSFGDEDGNYRVIAPRMLRDMPHLKRQMHMAPHVRTLQELKMDEHEMQKLQGEVDQLRQELQELRQELQER